MNGAPVFLFTDIEGSTKLWEAHPKAMGPVLSRHDALLRALVEAHGGTVVKTTGDGVHAVFAPADKPSDPLGAALAIQRAVQNEDWASLSGGAVAELRVRAGLHADDAEARGGDWYGPAVNRAARLMAAAWGG